MRNSDKNEIDSLIKEFFQTFTNKGGSVPNWNTIHETCIPEVIIIKKEGLAQEVYHLESFIRPRKKLLSDGTLINFEEWETKEETTIVGNIAQRKSDYEKAGTLNGTAFSQSGIKIFQLIKTETGWRIASVVWEDK